MGVGIWERAVSAVRPDKLGAHLWHMFRYNWHLGFTSFGGPAVHFKIVSQTGKEPGRKRTN